MKNKKLKFLILSCSFAFLLLPFVFSSFAQDNVNLEEAKILYFKEHKYNEFVEFLNSLLKAKKELAGQLNYYLGLTRYHQLKYLEDSQIWEEYFNQGNIYREQLTTGLNQAIALIPPQEPLYLQSKLILWRFHHDQQDAFHEQALIDLMSAASLYAKLSLDPQPIKDTADALLSYGERGKSRELYRAYVDKLVTSATKDEELNRLAANFHQEGNLELAESLYDVYAERVVKAIPKEDSIPILIEVVKKFSLEDRPKETSDPFYAEKIFKKIEGLGKDALPQDLAYQRAFNLEKAKEFAQAKDAYLELIQRFPQDEHFDEAVFKIGIIYTYILRDIKVGRGYFEGLAQKEPLSPQVISSFYQLGLLAHWEDDLAKAKEYYQRVLEKAGITDPSAIKKSGDKCCVSLEKDTAYPETVCLANERLKEIEEARPMEFNLKTFMDVSLKEDYAMILRKANLSASLYRPKQKEELEIAAEALGSESGCMQVELRYLWSGHIGATEKPSTEKSSFNTYYIHPATKEVNLVVVSPAGPVDYNLDMVDARKGSISLDK